MNAVRLDEPPKQSPTSAVVETVPSQMATPRPGRPARTGAKPKPTPFYLHPAVKEVLRDICYHHRIKEHDLFVEGLDLVLKKRGYPPIAEIVASAEKS